MFILVLLRPPHLLFSREAILRLDSPQFLYEIRLRLPNFLSKSTIVPAPNQILKPSALANRVDDLVAILIHPTEQNRLNGDLEEACHHFQQSVYQPRKQKPMTIRSDSMQQDEGTSQTEGALDQHCYSLALDMSQKPLQVLL